MEQEGRNGKDTVWTVQENIKVQGRLFQVVQDKWEEHNENKKAEKAGEVLLTSETRLSVITSNKYI